ncbi:BON domain-containing protein [uncultured Paraglaciecola sp.]|uniref:BON domain-containing protein n=1 Tax=uncultured Paraglaciecola sp. TaxID=1765024 RepID=UPI0026168929|nr:BON domain-containing protein [uncultured Paraglaciecola sp.]
MAATNDGAVSEDYGKRTMGTVLEDSSIESKAKINISRYNEILNNANINVTSYNRIILLTGQVPDIESKNQAGLVAEKVRNVRSVHNELEILPVNSIFDSSKDSFLKAKVSTNLLGAKGVDSDRIQVIVANSKVYLMGLVTQEEAKRTIDSVKEVSGLKAIIKVFEYIQNS